MKLCPVCQYEEEQDSEVSCAICGSDLESSAPTDEISTDTEEVIDEVPTESEKVIETTEESSVSDEEKLLEETLAATEVDDPDTEEQPSTISALTSIRDQWSKFGSSFKKFSSRLDSIFLTKGEINYVAPMAMLIASILLFFSVIGLAISTIPGVTEESTDGYTPTTPYSKNEVYVGRGTAESFSGDPFNCEIWDASRYEEFGGIGEDGYYIAVTDSNSNGTVEDDERFGCPVNMGYLSGFTFIILNLVLLVSAFYIYNNISNTSITYPILIFGSAEFLLFVVYGGIAVSYTHLTLPTKA